MDQEGLDANLYLSEDPNGPVTGVITPAESATVAVAIRVATVGE